MHKKLWNLRIRILPIVLGAALLLTGFFSMSSIKNLQGNARVINYTGLVRGATQRLVKQELSHDPNEQLILQVDEIIAGLLYGDTETGIIQLDSAAYQNLLLQMQSAWDDIKEEILLFRDGGQPNTLYQLSESFFVLADQAVSAAEQYTEECVQVAVKSLAGVSFAVLIFAFLVGVSMVLQQKRQEKLVNAEDENRKKSEQLSKMFEDIRAPMNEISELMYVSDLENYELLFINNAGRETFHIEDKAGQKCYKVLQGLDAPCPYCTTPFLRPGQNYSWEFTNPVVNRHYLLKDRLIAWEGRSARLEIAFDITESENEKIKLQNLLDSEKVIVECIRELYQKHDLHKAAEQVLDYIGKFLQADRVYILHSNEDPFTCAAEWCREGVPPKQEGVQHTLACIFQHCRTTSDGQDYVVVDDMEKLISQIPEPLNLQEMQGIKRFVIVAMEPDGQPEGYIGVDNPPLDRIQNSITILQTLCYFLMLARRQEQDEAKLAKLSYFDTLTGFFNRNRYIQDIQCLAEAKRTSVGVVFVDVNGLKEVNDQYGHDMGDSILKECANHIHAAFSENDHYRIGGDEFVVLCLGICQERFFQQAEKLRLSFEGEGDKRCQAAIGCEWTEENSCIQAVIAAADEKMYADKRAYYRDRQATKRYRHHNDGEA